MLLALLVLTLYQVRISEEADRGGHGCHSSWQLFHRIFSIAVHPQAAPVVCRHTLEVLISLAKSFPIHFLPGGGSTTPPSETTSNTSNTPSDKKTTKPAEFWETAQAEQGVQEQQEVEECDQKPLLCQHQIRG